jgi:hypothetical protein
VADLPHQPPHLRSQSPRFRGGITGDQYDPCYHLARETIEDINQPAFAVISDALAFDVVPSL